eukprot:COSAG03_NODE_1373_length_4219_cov_4.267961_1_plen_37_part_00
MMWHKVSIPSDLDFEQSKANDKKAAVRSPDEGRSAV